MFFSLLIWKIEVLFYNNLLWFLILMLKAFGHNRLWFFRHQNWKIVFKGWVCSENVGFWVSTTFYGSKIFLANLSKSKMVLRISRDSSRISVLTFCIKNSTFSKTKHLSTTVAMCFGKFQSFSPKFNVPVLMLVTG